MGAPGGAGGGAAGPGAANARPPCSSAGRPPGGCACRAAAPLPCAAAAGTEAGGQGGRRERGGEGEKEETSLSLPAHGGEVLPARGDAVRLPPGADCGSRSPALWAGPRLPERDSPACREHRGVRSEGVSAPPSAHQVPQQNTNKVNCFAHLSEQLSLPMYNACYDR